MWPFCEMSRPPLEAGESDLPPMDERGQSQAAPQGCHFKVIRLSVGLRFKQDPT